MVDKERAEAGLAGKVALVTGAGHGIGRATAFALAAAGAAMAVNDVDPDRARETAAALVAGGHKATSVPGDVSSAAQVTQMVADTLQGHGQLDILVNNAGGTFNEQRFENFAAEDLAFIERILNVNLSGTLLCSRAVFSHMVERKSGCIVSISSSVALAGDAKSIVYSAAKGGVVSFTRSFARAMAPHGVRVNCVVPGTIDSGNRPPEYVAKQTRRVPLGRAGTPQDVGRVIAFLASEAAGFITGQVIPVNGGQTMQ